MVVGTYPGHVIDAQDHTISGPSAGKGSIGTDNGRGRALRAIHKYLVIVKQVYVSDLPSAEVARQQAYTAVELYLRIFLNDALQLGLRSGGNAGVRTVLAQREVVHLRVTHRTLHVLFSDDI